MASDLIVVHIASFLAWTSGVAIITWYICSKGLQKSSNAADEYFAGGRSLAWYIVAGSLMLTNLSTEQLVGLNGAIFTDGCLAGSAWETFAALAMCVTASVFLPRYIKTGLATTTGFLGERFDLQTRTLVSAVFLIFYAVGLCPSVLYSGALAIRSIFGLEVPLWIVSTGVGLIGACYAIFGGLKAVVVSDCLNGVGLLVVGLWVPLAALGKIGGLSNLFAEPRLLKPLLVESDIYDDETMTRSPGSPSVPWHTLITGMMMQHLYYWSTNQLIVQRALAARSLSEGQKGVLFAAAMKVVGFLMLCIPGTIGTIMAQKGILVDGEPFVVHKSDEIYPLVVKAVMPQWTLGLFVAVLLGSILSTFNSALNSAATLFGLEIYKIYIDKDAPDTKVVKAATWFSVVLALASFVIAPRLEAVSSIFDFLQRAKTMASLPIITVFVVGIATKLPDAFAAKVGFVVGAVLYGLGGQLLDEPHYLHVFFICFLISGAAIFAATYAAPLRTCLKLPARPEPHVFQESSVVDVKSWAYLQPLMACIVVLVIWLTFSMQIASLPTFLAFAVAWLLVTLTLMALPCEKPSLSAPESKTELELVTKAEEGVKDNGAALDTDAVVVGQATADTSPKSSILPNTDSEGGPKKAAVAGSSPKMCCFMG